ncbi:Membrane-bound transcription factor site-2 protease [Physocladia obscura]|uniref:Endopeptidase S2P n=1 Tax=Physocladia obscura TaxID=109957 RepID=A0AAD5TBH3_9FUNG|nr:Membrane-bound transcription factor site-2 protease [Physocladia obscura]
MYIACFHYQIPGVNLPIFALGYYFSALLTSGIVHEFGHAFSAAIENVPLESAGVFVTIIFPGAFVELRDSALSKISPRSRLRIICAGVWHNAVIGLISYITLIFLPFWLSWGYRDLRSVSESSASLSQNRIWKGGVVVLDVIDKSPLHESLPFGTIIAGIDDWYIGDGINSWDFSLMTSLSDAGFTRQGYCLDKKYAFSNTRLDCCNVNTELPLGDFTNTQQCFLPKHSVEFRREIEISSDTLHNIPKVCASLDSVVRFGKYCSSDTECSSASQCMAAYIPNPYIRIVRLHVFEIFSKNDHTQSKLHKESAVASLNKSVEVDLINSARLFSTQNLHKNFDLMRKKKTSVEGEVHVPVRTLLYLGDPREISEAVRVGSLYPKCFMIAFNTALALFNMIPAFQMDGHQAVDALLDMVVDFSLDHEETYRRKLGNFGSIKIRLWKKKIMFGLGVAYSFLLGATVLIAVYGAFQ